MPTNLTDNRLREMIATYEAFKKRVAPYAGESPNYLVAALRELLSIREQLRAALAGCGSLHLGDCAVCSDPETLCAACCGKLATLARELVKGE